MSIIAVITDLEILNTPPWYDAFTKKYLSRPKPHITLLQPRVVNEELGLELLENISSIARSLVNKFPMSARLEGITAFEDGTGCMIGLHCPQIREIQKSFMDCIPKSIPYLFPQGLEREIDFWPHLTLADMIPEGKLEEVIAEYGLHELRLDVKIHTLICALPPDFSLEESKREENFYTLF